MTRTELLGILSPWRRRERKAARREEARAELIHLLTILRRIRQVNCGQCWAYPGHRCWRMRMDPGSGHRVATRRTMLGVHASRVLRSHGRGVIDLDLPPGMVEFAARDCQTRAGVWTS